MEVVIKKMLIMRSTLYKDIDASILSNLSLIAENLKLDAKSLASSFDKFMTVSRQESTQVTMDDVETFRKEQQVTKAAKAHNNIFARQNWEDLDKDDIQEIPKAGHRISPYFTQKSSSAVQPKPNLTIIPKLEQPLAIGDFKERCNNATIHAVLNDHIQIPKSATTENTSCEIQILGTPVESGTRYMMDRLADKAAYFDHIISTAESDIEAAMSHSQSTGNPHPIATAVQQKSFFVGRICCDAEEGRLNPHSIVVEGSSSLSHGARVKLDLASCPEYRLFPGQVVAVKGTNPSGFCITASEVFPGLPLPLNQPMEIDGTKADGTNANTSYVIASGPYTTSENLLYEPLAVLLEYCKTHQPDVLLLHGPFVDADHPLLRDGLLEETFEEVFATGVLAQLANFRESVDEEKKKTQILLMPSPKDAHHDPVFPQGPMKPAQDRDGKEIITNLANPCTFACNGVVIGSSSVDWLMSCTKEEISKSSKPADRLPTLAMHLIHQRSFFPMYPPPLGVPMDTTLGYALELPCTPNFLVSPSDLAPFAKHMPLNRATCLSVDDDGSVIRQEGSVICINPGRLTKGSSAGTFAHMYCVASTEGVVDSSCRVEIRKL